MGTFIRVRIPKGITKKVKTPDGFHYEIPPEKVPVLRQPSPITKCCPVCGLEPEKNRGVNFRRLGDGFDRIVEIFAEPEKPTVYSVKCPKCGYTISGRNPDEAEHCWDARREKENI